MTAQNINKIKVRVYKLEFGVLKYAKAGAITLIHVFNMPIYMRIGSSVSLFGVKIK